MSLANLHRKRLRIVSATDLNTPEGLGTLYNGIIREKGLAQGVLLRIDGAFLIR